MRHAFSTAAALIATFALVAADAPTCGGGTKCPQSSPCCSEYGACGVGAYCLQGCDPKNSFDLNSCMATPVCKSGDFKLNSLNDVSQNTVFLGDSSKTNWISSGIPVVYQNDALLLTMAESTVGTLLTSTHYVWYGKITATMMASAGKGVVTAFIMMSAMKDEIDFEFVGENTGSVQSNYYFQGVTDYNQMKPLTVDSTNGKLHTYTIDWQPDQLTWSVDGTVMRTVKKSDTWNSTDNTFHYPQSPSRIQLSLWPAGLPSNGEGTITWAGGLVNWNSNYMQNGYYYAMVKDVSVECYNPPSSFKNNFGSNAYYYQNVAGTEDTVAIGNNVTTLSSFYASGDNPTYDPYGKTQSGSAPVSTPSTAPETVPGISGGGVRGTDGSTGSGTSGSSGSTDGSGSSGSTAAGSSGFSQNGGASPSTGEAAPKLAAGSAVALIGFIIAALML